MGKETYQRDQLQSGVAQLLPAVGNIREKRPIYVNRDPHMGKETRIWEKRPTQKAYSNLESLNGFLQYAKYVKRDPYTGKETYKRELLQSGVAQWIPAVGQYVKRETYT